MSWISIRRYERIVFSALLMFLIASMLLPNVFMRRVVGGTYDTRQLTSNLYYEYDPKIDNGMVVWHGSDGTDYEIYLYDVSDETTEKISTTDNYDYNPQIDNGMVVWHGSDGTDYEIYLYNGASTTQLTWNTNYDYNPQIDNGKVVWYGSDGTDYEIYLYDGGSPVAITANSQNDYDPKIEGEIVVWRGYDGTDYEIYMYDISVGGTPTAITANSYNDYDPQIDNGRVVWEGSVGADYEIFLYADGETTQITDNDYYDYDPQISGDKIVWYGYHDGADGEIFLYDISTNTTRQITNNPYGDWYPRISGEKIVWHGYDVTANREIFLHDLTTNTTEEITSNNYEDRDPQIDGERVVWEGYEGGGDSEIFFTIVDTTTPETTISLSGTQGDNNWWISDVKVELSATDTGGTGVANTSYSLDDGENWLLYSTSFNLTEEGNNKILYYSIDNAIPPNKEPTRQRTVKIDKTPPTGSIVIDEGATYTNSTSVTLTLTGIDQISGVDEVRFSNDSTTWSNWESYSDVVDRTLTSGDGNKTLYVQLKNDAGSTSQTYEDSMILDTLPPSVTPVTFIENDTLIRSSKHEWDWTATDRGGAGVDHYEVRLDDDAWIDVGNATTYTFERLSGGSHVFSVKAVDKTNKTGVYSLSVMINTTPIGGPGLLEEAIIGIVIAVIVIALVLFLIRRPKKPLMPKKMIMKAEPAEIVADGESKTTITIQLLDKKDKAISALENVEVKLQTTGGKIETPTVTILQGEQIGRAVLMSSPEGKTVTLKAEASGLKSASTTVVFKEKVRFCMGCGTRLSVKDMRCTKCGAIPDEFTGPAKICKNCERTSKRTYLPASAEFCSECGASQPKGE